MAAVVTLKCIVPYCDEILSPHARIKECPKCRARMLTWFKRSPAECLAYRLSLARRNASMELILPGDVSKLSKEGATPKLAAPDNYQPTSKQGKARRTRAKGRRTVTTKRGARVEYRAAQ